MPNKRETKSIFFSALDIFCFYFWQHHRLWSKGSHRTIDRSKQVTIESKKRSTHNPLDKKATRCRIKGEGCRTAVGHSDPISLFNGVPKAASPLDIYLPHLPPKSPPFSSLSPASFRKRDRIAIESDPSLLWLLSGDFHAQLMFMTSDCVAAITHYKSQIDGPGNRSEMEMEMEKPLDSHQNKISIDRSIDRPTEWVSFKSRSKSFEWECGR